MPGTIDELNFKVILDDAEFDAKVKNDIKLAKELNIALSSLVDLKKQVGRFTQDDVNNNRKAQQILKDNARAQEAITREKLKTEGVQKRINAQIERATKGYQSQSRILNELKGYMLGYLSVHGAGQLLSSLVRVTGEFELQKTTLAAMLGDLNAAEGVITRIQGLAVESPFQFKELTTYAKQLSAFSVPAQELYDTTKMLADISAGLGVGMDRIVLAYGQVRSAAFLRGQEVRQFTEAGIPILDELAKQFSELEGRAVSTGEVFDKISARLVPFEMVAKVFKDMTSEGGKFYNMQEVQAETLRGKISNLKDAYEVMLNEIGKGQSENLKGAVDWAIRLMQNYEETGRNLISLVAAYGVYKTTLIAIELLTRTFSVTNHKLLNSLKQVGTWMIANPYALIAAGITAAGLATYKWVTYMTDAEKIQKSVTDSHEKYNEALASEYSMLKALYAKLDLYTEGTLEHDKAKAEIMRKYAPYIEQLRQEGVEVNNLADIYTNLADKIRQSLQTRAYESSIQGLDEAYKEAEDRADKMLENSLKANRKGYTFSETDKLTLSMYVKGGLDEDKAFNKLSDSAKQYFTDFNVFLKKQRGNMADAMKAYLDGIDEVSDAYQTFQAEAEQTPDKLSLFAETVQKELAKFGATKDNKGKFAGLWADNLTEYYDYLDKIRKEYESVKQKIKDVGSTQKENLPDLKKQKEAIEAIAKALKISLDKGDYGKGKSPAQKAIEEQIKSVQKLQDAYEKLMPYLNEVQMKSTLKAIFPNIDQSVIDSLDFDAELTRLADRLEEFDKDAAQRLRDTIGKDVAGTIAESFKAVEQYKKMMDSWLGEDFNLSGKGISFDISKIISNLNSEYAKIDQKRAKALDLLNKAQMGDEVALAKVREVLGEEAWQKYLVNGSRVIDELAARERRAAKVTADEKIRDLADKYIKEQMSKRNVNLTEFEDKTLQQIQKQIDKLKDMKSDAQEALNKIYQGGVSESEIGQMELYEEIIKRLGIILEDTGEELGKQIVDRIKVAANSLADLGASIEKLGEGGTLARLGSGLSKAAEEFSGLVEQFGELGEALDAKDTIALIANLASYAISEVTDIITAAYERQRVLNEASAEYAEILRQIRRESYSGIFGTDEMGLAAENAKILAEEQKKYADTLEKFQKTKFQQFGGSFWRKDSISNTIADFAGKEGWDLYLENGELNIAALEAYYDAYSSRLTKKQRDLVSTLIEQGNILDDAASQQAEYLTSLFNGVADNIADGMIEAFLESGDAAMDMGNIISDVSRQMVADLIKSVYLMPILESYRKQFEAIDANTALEPTERTEQQLALLETALAQISGQSDNITATIERFEEYLRAGEGEEGTTDLGQGIKGITEDQANLLASYLNAIRADVSYSKALWERMDVNLQRIADMFTSSPTLMEYQAQIAANTYNTAQATQQILAELRSVVTTDSGDTAIRVYS